MSREGDYERLLPESQFTRFDDNRTAVPLGETIDPGDITGQWVLRCTAEAPINKGPSIVWVRNGEEVIPDDDRVTIDNETFASGSRTVSDLRIRNFTQSDAGVYQCIFTTTGNEILTTTPLRLDTGMVLV